ncbi:MAG: hypothetical protein MJA28_00550 [Gammaproteobacteria bacterium]|nr:hypothetical protein [Gammaproteobacteria bacterium]
MSNDLPEPWKCQIRPFLILPLLLIAAFILSPVGPHMLLNYTYEQRGSYKYMLSCQYLGSRGFVHYVAMGECPYFKIIDSREFPKR